MRLPWHMMTLLGLVACEGRSCASTAHRTAPTEAQAKSASVTCQTLPIRLGGIEGFFDCVKGPPIQNEYPECYTISFDVVPGLESVCPPTRLLMSVNGWPKVADRYEVELRQDSTTGTTELLLTREPGGQVGPRGPAPGHAGEILGRIKTVDGKFSEFLPNRAIRTYQPDVALPRRALL